MPEELRGGGTLHGSLGQVGSRPTLAAATRLRVLRVRLTASLWLETQNPYLVLEVPDDELPQWAPGFETAMDGIVDIVPNPFVRVERYDVMVVLLLHGEGYWTLASEDWPNEGECDVFVVSRRRLPPDAGARREVVLADLLNSGEAYFSRVTIDARGACELP